MVVHISHDYLVLLPSHVKSQLLYNTQHTHTHTHTAHMNTLQLQIVYHTIIELVHTMHTRVCIVLHSHLIVGLINGCLCNAQCA